MRREEGGRVEKQIPGSLKLTGVDAVQMPDKPLTKGNLE